MRYWILQTCILWMFFLELTWTINRRITFEEGRCRDDHFTVTSQENVTVTHITSTTASSYCQYISFYGWDSIVYKQKEVCVKPVNIELDCSQKLLYIVREDDASPSKHYDCTDPAEQIPRFCTFDTLFIRIKSENRNKKISRVTYTVYSGREKDKITIDYSSSSSSFIAIIVGVLGLFAAILIPVMCIRLKKARALQNQNQTVSYRRNLQPRTTRDHHYHQVTSHRFPDTLSDRASGPNHLPQGHNTQAWPSLPQPSAPAGYHLSPTEHIISPYTSLSAEQQARANSYRPPPYEDVSIGKTVI